MNGSAGGFVPIVSWRLLGGRSSSRVAAVTLAPDFELELRTPEGPFFEDAGMVGAERRK